MPTLRTLLKLNLIVAASALSPGAWSAELPELISYEPDGAQVGTTIEHAISSPSGRFVLFLVVNMDGGADRKCFRWHLRDRDLGTTEIISRKANGEPVDCDHVVFRGTSANMDSTGRFVVFDQYGGGIVPDALPIGARVYLRDRTVGTVRLIGPPPSVRASHPSIDDHGTRVAMIVGTSDDRVLNVYEVNSGQLIRSTVARNFSEPVISGDGRRVVFTALPDGSIFVVRSQVYLLHVDDGRVEILSAAANGTVGNERSFNPTINFDGSVVAFETRATDLVPGGLSRLLIRNVDARTTEAVRDGQGVRIQGGTPSLSGDGNRLAYHGYLNYPAYEQAFVWDRTTREATLLSRNALGQAATLGLISGRCNTNIGPCVATDYVDLNPTISGNGRHVAFVSRGPNLVSGDANGNGIDVYAVDLGLPSGTPAAVPLGRTMAALLAALVAIGAAISLRARAA